MKAISVIAIFDIGKTNKKLLLFDEHYKLVWERATQLEEITDEDGFPCENIEALSSWVQSSIESLLSDNQFSIKAINFSAYGASFVYVDKNGKTILPLYNYLKPFPKELSKKFYLDYGGEQIHDIRGRRALYNRSRQFYAAEYGQGSWCDEKAPVHTGRITERFVSALSDSETKDLFLRLHGKQVATRQFRLD